jgi:hypothetical protein
MRSHATCGALAALLLALLLALAAPAAAATDPPAGPVVGVSGPDDGPLAALAATPEAAAPYRFERIGFSTTLWADGRGDVVLDLELTNLALADWRSLTWGFGWSSGAYSQIRANDDRGPLPVVTSRQGDAILISPQFRAPVPIGARTRLALALTIGAMAQGGGSQWRASWRTTSGSPVGAYVERLALPSNAVVRSVTPPPAARTSNTLEWRTASATPGWSFGLDVAYTLSDRIAARLFRQTDPLWGGKPYGSYADDDKTNTVSWWGCYMTAAAMVARYHADQQGAAPRIDPGDLNAWLRANKRYKVNSFDPLSLPDYAAGRGVILTARPQIVGGRSDANDRLLDDYLRSGNPVILEVPAKDSPSGIHFVVAVGRATAANGAVTYQVLDPVYGETTLADRYENVYTRIIPFTGSAGDARAISFSGHSPIELLVTDPQGRRVGLDPRTGQRYAEIPGAVYTTEAVAPAGGEGGPPAEPVKTVTIFAPLDGIYAVEVIGTGAGPYTLVTLSADWQGHTAVRSQQGQAAPNAATVYPASYSAVGGISAYTVALPLVRR